jgi:F-type H+-transporting ATPase subunit b
MPAPASLNRRACESWRKLRARCASALVLFALVLGPTAFAQPAQGHRTEPGAAAAAGQPAQPSDAHAEAPASEHAVAEGHTAEGQHAESPWFLIGKIFNFALLAGTIVYFLRKPFSEYLARRDTQIRSDLITAATMKDEAARQLAAIEARLTQLPGELEALRARGHEEIAAEEARIREAAAADRDRLLEQTRREIELQLRIARRELITHAADLAVQVARERIRSRITDDDQRRLVDRYLAQVKVHE